MIEMNQCKTFTKFPLGCRLLHHHLLFASPLVTWTDDVRQAGIWLLVAMWMEENLARPGTPNLLGHCAWNQYGFNGGPSATTFLPKGIGSGRSFFLLLFLLLFLSGWRVSPTGSTGVVPWRDTQACPSCI